MTTDSERGSFGTEPSASNEISLVKSATFEVTWPSDSSARPHYVMYARLGQEQRAEASRVSGGERASHWILGNELSVFKSLAPSRSCPAQSSEMGSESERKRD
ncbi:hypothetical protein FA13DRAFT_1741437 [Coprinellus micaceus]|uniref:Uncharacterized protein n=1 Tax=Coprinellus micaceus TaxID=71717 RepID=A0A4Y7SJ83_COPMI|nr:hypothetical protein FA13DRAFT_1741437 [Coprinellus micaceus]